MSEALTGIKINKFKNLIMGGKKEKGCQGTCIKDTWTKSKRLRIEGGRWGWVGQGESWGENGDNCT